MKTLKPYQPSKKIEAEIRDAIIKAFKEKIYKPLLADIDLTTRVLNSDNDLIKAIKSGRLIFEDGQFKGKFSSRTSLSLKKLGAVWDKKQGSFKIPSSKLSPEIKAAVQYQTVYLDEMANKVLMTLDTLNSKEIADSINVKDYYQKELFMVNDFINKQIQGISVAAQFTEEQMEQIAIDYNYNMDLYIQKWIDEEIVELRSKVQEQTVKGVRYDALAKTIEQSYGVSKNKAKFLARQETHLLVGEMNKQKYTSAGFDKYIWKTVKGTAAHPVRDSHKLLDGKVISWNNPPIVDFETGRRAHAGMDFNCRCVALTFIEGIDKE